MTSDKTNDKAPFFEKKSFSEVFLPNRTTIGQKCGFSSFMRK